MPSNQITRVLYSVSQALSVAGATGTSFSDAGLPISLGVSSVAATLEYIKSYSFQGASIAQASLVNDTYITIPNQTTTESTTESSSPEKTNYSQLFAELGLNTTSMSFTIANRYFLVTSLFTVFGLPLSANIIWPIVISDAAFKTLFDLTNELYETNEALATYMNNGVETKPVYANWRLFRAIADCSVARDMLAVVGTLEHSIVDDLLPWILFVPEPARKILATTYRRFSLASPVAKTFAILAPLIGSLLAIVIIFQTILFEAEHSYEAYCKILNEKTDWIKSLFERMSLSSSTLQILKYASWLMPACHGAASAAPVYVWMKKLLSINESGLFATHSMADTLTSAGTLVTTLFTFFFTARGHYLSEFRESLDLIDGRIQTQTQELESVIIQ